jgi:hypothetical protein
MRAISLLVLTGISAFAGTIGTYTFTGTATGTIGNTAFTNASLVVTAMGGREHAGLAWKMRRAA